MTRQKKRRKQHHIKYVGSGILSEIQWNQTLTVTISGPSIFDDFDLICWSDYRMLRYLLRWINWHVAEREKAAEWVSSAVWSPFYSLLKSEPNCISAAMAELFFQNENKWRIPQAQPILHFLCSIQISKHYSLHLIE